MMDCITVRPLGSRLNKPMRSAFRWYILNTTASGMKTSGCTMAKIPRAHLQVLIVRIESATNGPTKAVQMNGVEAKPNAKARLRRPAVSATKMSIT